MLGTKVGEVMDDELVEKFACAEIVPFNEGVPVGFVMVELIIEPWPLALTTAVLAVAGMRAIETGPDGEEMMDVVDETLG